ncbi:hypothetical protein RB2513 [Rhodopirellula baltica SH 1]|uniref:Uncharacterized protein n=1 Tax=Rhodopirellula baltica (strain DSM 10527 / NCIMB 13988 / SH1) TaxID=243090 RepID=Q7UVN8_RHOBA|nr:hypothetical protein RB2513 [Rhodopirellula baltica SH 1]
MMPVMSAVGIWSGKGTQGLRATGTQVVLAEWREPPGACSEDTGIGF